jgi:prepilin peptidase CpaA
MLGTYITADNAVIVAVVVLILIAGYTDYRKRLIENRLTLPAIGIGFLLNFIGHGWQGILSSSLGLMTGVGLFMLPFMFGKLGGGDVKLMGAIGAMLGSHSVLNVVLYTALAGGVFAISASFLNNSLNDTIHRVRLLLGKLFRRKTTDGKPACTPSGQMIPYGLAIGAGTICFLALGAIV